MNAQIRNIFLSLTWLTLAACGNQDTGAEHSGKTQETHEEHGAEASEEHGSDEAHDDHEEGDGSLQLSDEQLRKAGIELAVAAPEVIREQIPLYGTIVPNAERVREVTARFPGVIQSVAKQIGDAVKQGDRLATVESNESLKAYPVVAPLAGVITERHAYAGEQAGDKPLFTVADLSTVWAEIALFPRDVNKVRAGQRVEIIGGDAALSAEGKVIYVAPLGTRANQTITARVLLDNKEGQWSPGLYVTAQVTASATKADVAVLNTAIQIVDGSTVVFVRADDEFEPRTVRLGKRDSRWTELLDGIQPGESYVAKNSFILKAELGKGSAEHEH
jgi:cobalt-zinc-cadmium efflux system membrane fusion protein